MRVLPYIRQSIHCPSEQECDGEDEPGVSKPCHGHTDSGRDFAGGGDPGWPESSDQECGGHSCQQGFEREGSDGKPRLDVGQAQVRFDFRVTRRMIANSAPSV